MPSFRTKAASKSHLNIHEAKRIMRRSWRGAVIAKRMSAKAERKQAKLNLTNY